MQRKIQYLEPVLLHDHVLLDDLVSSDNEKLNLCSTVLKTIQKVYSVCVLCTFSLSLTFRICRASTDENRIPFRLSVIVCVRV